MLPALGMPTLLCSCHVRLWVTLRRTKSRALNDEIHERFRALEEEYR